MASEEPIVRLAPERQCKPTLHILQCGHRMASQHPLPCSKTCLNPSSPRDFDYNCIDCFERHDKQLIDRLMVLDTLLYAYDPTGGVPPVVRRPNPWMVEEVILHDSKLPYAILRKMPDPLRARKFWFQYRMDRKIGVAFCLLTARSVRNRLSRVHLNGCFAIGPDTSRPPLTAEQRARMKAKLAIRNLVLGQRAALIESRCPLDGVDGLRCEAPKIGQDLEAKFREQHVWLWAEMHRLLGTTNPASTESQ